MIAFETGKTYTTISICDSNLTYEFTIEKRTEKTVWVKVDGEVKARRVSEYDGAETFYPFGKYSMAPSVRATSEKAEEPVVIEYTATTGAIDLRVPESTPVTFPKYVRARRIEVLFPLEKRSEFYTGVSVNLSPDAVNGGVNESGLKRLVAFVKGCAAVGPVTFERRHSFANDINLPPCIK